MRWGLLQEAGWPHHLLSSCQLHHLVSDDVCLKVVELYLNEKKRGAAGGNLSSRCVRAARETSYQWKAERCMADENCFKVRGGLGLTSREAQPLTQLWTQSWVDPGSAAGTSALLQSPGGTIDLQEASGLWKGGKGGWRVALRACAVPAGLSQQLRLSASLLRR